MIDNSLLQRLRGIGFAPSLLQLLAQVAPNQADIDELAPLRVVEVQREGLVLHDGQAECTARLYPALRTQLAAAGDAIACGDWVLAERNTFGEWWVHTRLPPLNQLARRLHDGRDKVERVVIVSNVDTALLVMGLDHDFNLRRLERYVALVRMAGVAAVVVLTKRDLAADAAARLQQVQAVLPADVMAVAVNALGDEPRRAARTLAATRADAGAAGLQRRRQEHADECVDRCDDGQRRAVHRPEPRWRQPRPPHHHCTLAAHDADGRLHHRHAWLAHAAARR